MLNAALLIAALYCPPASQRAKLPPEPPSQCVEARLLSGRVVTLCAGRAVSVRDGLGNSRDLAATE